MRFMFPPWVPILGVLRRIALLRAASQFARWGKSRNRFFVYPLYRRGISLSKLRRCAMVVGPGCISVTFLLVRQVKLPKRLDLARDAERALAALPGSIVRNWVEDRRVLSGPRAPADVAMSDSPSRMPECPLRNGRRMRRTGRASARSHNARCLRHRVRLSRGQVQG